jgi:hypothetical protein
MVRTDPIHINPAACAGDSWPTFAACPNFSVMFGSLANCSTALSSFYDNSRGVSGAGIKSPLLSAHPITLANNCGTYFDAVANWQLFSGPSLFGLSLLTVATSDSFVDADRWRSLFADTIEQLRAAKTEQLEFWKLFDAIERDVVPVSFTALLRPVTMGAAGAAFRDWLGPDTRSLIEHFSEWHEQRDLSTRNIKGILGTLSRALDGREEALRLDALLARIRETLTNEVANRATWRLRRHQPVTKARAASTHDWVVGFVLHTGISPPTGPNARPPVGRALVTTTNAQQVNYEMVRRRQTFPDPRNPLRARCTRAHFDRGPRNYASFGRCAQPSGCRRVGNDYSLAQCA